MQKVLPCLGAWFLSKIVLRALRAMDIPPGRELYLSCSAISGYLQVVRQSQAAGSDLALMTYGKWNRMYVSFIGTSVSLAGPTKELCIAKPLATQC